jgi:hypothetical protein
VNSKRRSNHCVQATPVCAYGLSLRHWAGATKKTKGLDGSIMAHHRMAARRSGLAIRESVTGCHR